ncbi:hypothetical protein D3C83_53060 [compost metagenome]
MVGTSGRMAARLLLVTARPRSFPACTCGAPEEITEIRHSTCPEMASTDAGAPPL